MAAFNVIDANHDGQISRQEFARAMGGGQPVSYGAPPMMSYGAPQQVTYAAPPVQYAAPPVQYAAPQQVQYAPQVQYAAAPVQYAAPPSPVRYEAPVVQYEAPVVYAQPAPVTQQVMQPKVMRTNPNNLLAGGVVVQEQEYSREDMINMGFLYTFDQYFDMMDANHNGQMSPEELRAGATRVNNMLELKPHEVQSKIEQMLGIRSFANGTGGDAYQGNFQQYLAPAQQGGHGLGYSERR